MLKQRLQQKLLQKLSPQQIQLMKLLQLPTIAFEQRIKEELEKNPALEEGKEEDDEIMQEEEDFSNEENSNEEENDFDISDYLNDDEIPDYKLTIRNKGNDDDDKVMPLPVTKTFHEHLIEQLRLKNLNELEFNLGKYLIGNLDNSGYLRRELSSIVDDLILSYNIKTNEKELFKILRIIHTLEPKGVGARDLRECLLIQLEDKKNKNSTYKNAYKIIKKYFTEFSKKHYDKIIVKMGISQKELKEATNVILKLNPKPGNSLSESGKSASTIIPDFIVSLNDGELELVLNSKNAPELKISKKYVEMLQHYSKDKSSKTNKEALLFVKQKLDSAKWFIEAIKQRQQTLLLTMKAIIDYQYDYFVTGDERKLKPMILKNIAEKVNLDISTISRVANSKYVQTPYGIFPLKYFFSESISTTSGEEVSSKEVKKILQDLIEKEDKHKPLTDEKLTKLLKDKGYNIARRTVAKYREQLHIPVARLRKEL